VRVAADMRPCVPFVGGRRKVTRTMPPRGRMPGLRPARAVGRLPRRSVHFARPSAPKVTGLKAAQGMPADSYSRAADATLWRRIITYLRTERKWLAVAIAVGLAAGAVVGPVVATLLEIVEDRRLVQ
jgi:hypothetical protein